MGDKILKAWEDGMPIDLAEVTGQKAAMEKKDEPKIANGLDKDAFMKLF